MIVQLSTDILSLSAASRATGVAKTTINSYIKKAADQTERMLCAQKESFVPQEARLDELWSFVKRKKTVSDLEIETGTGETWIWTAMDIPTRMMLNRNIGGHKLKDGYANFDVLSNLKSNSHLFMTGEIANYKTVLADLRQNKIQVPLTGQRGRPRKPILEIDPELNYATVKKIRQKGRVIKTIRSIIY